MVRFAKFTVITFLSIYLLFGVWLLVRAFAFDYFKIPTQSMKPTMQPGDEAVVNKFVIGARIYDEFEFTKEGQELKAWRTNGLRQLRHNDIAVFNFPQHGCKISFVINNVYCKRVVAIPGDSISIVDGWYKNDHYKGLLGIESGQRELASMTDSMVYPASLRTIPFDEHFDWTIRNFGPMYIPRKGDVIRISPYEATLYRLLLEWETGKSIDIDWERNRVLVDGRPMIWHTFLHNYYFMAGDNVINSNDSRYWGLVPEEYVVGVVTFIIRPKEKRIIRL